LQQKSSSWFGNTWAHAAEQLEKQTGTVAEEIGKQTQEAVEGIETGTAEAAGKVARETARTAMRASGLCPKVRENAAKVPMTYSVKFAKVFQKSDEEPSSSDGACQRILWKDINAEIQHGTGDSSGLVGQAAGAMSGDILSKVCGEALMDTLRSNAPIRQKDAPAYRRKVETTLRTHVLTHHWISEEIGIYCGSPHYARLFAEDEGPGTAATATSWARSTSVLTSTALLAMSALAIALVVAVGRLVARRLAQGAVRGAPLPGETATRPDEEAAFLGGAPDTGPLVV
jgi:hypothetical protein